MNETKTAPPQRDTPHTRRQRLLAWLLAATPLLAGFDYIALAVHRGSVTSAHFGESTFLIAHFHFHDAFIGFTKFVAPVLWFLFLTVRSLRPSLSAAIVQVFTFCGGIAFYYVVYQFMGDLWVFRRS